MADQATWEERPKEIRIVEEALSDDSKVYSVEVRQHAECIKFDCLDKQHAENFYHQLICALDSHTINDYKTL